MIIRLIRSPKYLSKVLPLGLAALGLATIAPAVQAETLTICEYDPAQNLDDPLNSGDALTGRARIVATSIDGVSTLTYRYSGPAPIEFSQQNQTFQNPLRTEQRKLTFYDTDLSSARQQVIDNSEYYAYLVGGDAEELERRGGYAEYDKLLTCREENATRGVEPPANTEAKFDALPDGNYRVASADLPFRVVTTEELVQSEGSVFRFKKTGSTVVGDFYYPETSSSLCVEGTLSGDVVTGRGRINGPEGTLPRSSALSFDAEASGLGFNDITLNLTSFSRINAGSVLPKESCE